MNQPSTKPQKMANLALGNGISQDMLHIPDLGALLASEEKCRYRFWRLMEISEEKPGAYQRAMENVIGVLQGQSQVQMVYLLRGNAQEVQLYFGLAVAGKNIDLHESSKNLHSALLGHLPGANLEEAQFSENDLSVYRHFGVALGVPTAHEDDSKEDEDDFQGIERLIRALQSHGNTWQIALVARPLERKDIEERIDLTMNLSSQAATWSKATRQVSNNSATQHNDSTSTSVSDGSSKNDTTQRGKNEGGSEGKNSGSSSGGGSSSTNKSVSISTNRGTSESVSIGQGTSHSESVSQSHSDGSTQGQSDGVNLELHDKWSQSLLNHLEENLLPRLRKGLNKGLYDCACYLAASDKSTFDLLAAEVRSTFQGDVETSTPIDVHHLQEKSMSLEAMLDLPMTKNPLSAEKNLVHSFHNTRVHNAWTIASALCVDEVALMAGMPRREVNGIVRRKNVDFSMSLPSVIDENALELGYLIDRGRQIDQRIRLDRKELDKHVFITGVTGSGKTTTCLNLLLESKLPFLVIEPAKTEYRALLSGDWGFEVDCYRPGEDRYNSLRINPFQLVHKHQKLVAQVSLIQATLAAVFPLEASMPQLVEMAIVRAYEQYGWDIHRNENDLVEDPWEPMAQVWPTFSDMIAQLDQIIPEQNMGKEFEDKYRGSLVSRLSALTKGILGATLDTPYSMDFNLLIERHAIIELEGLPNPEHKALLMGLILGRLAEAMKARHRQQFDYRHLTLIEEAHRLLARPEPGESDNRKNAVETFANLLAEIRKYGEGLLIADQIPNKLVSDVIKNTHVKIVHRLYAEDDRRTVGEAMMLDEKQRAFLPNLQTGEAVVYRGGWHGAARVKIEQRVRTDESPISDEMLHQDEIKLFARQRYALYPHLSKVCEDMTDEDFAEFVRNARASVNLLFKMFTLLTGDNMDIKLESFGKRLQEILKRDILTYKKLEDIEMRYAALLQDGRPRLRSNIKINGSWDSSYSKTFLKVFWDIVESLGSDSQSIVDIMRVMLTDRDKKSDIWSLARFESL